MTSKLCSVAGCWPTPVGRQARCPAGNFYWQLAARIPAYWQMRGPNLWRLHASPQHCSAVAQECHRGVHLRQAPPPAMSGAQYEPGQQRVPAEHRWCSRLQEPARAQAARNWDPSAPMGAGSAAKPSVSSSRHWGLNSETVWTQAGSQTGAGGLFEPWLSKSSIAANEWQWPRSNVPEITASSVRQLPVIKNCRRSGAHLGSVMNSSRLHAWLPVARSSRAARNTKCAASLFILPSKLVGTRRRTSAAGAEAAVPGYRWSGALAVPSTRKTLASPAVWCKSRDLLQRTGKQAGGRWPQLLSDCLP